MTKPGFRVERDTSRQRIVLTLSEKATVPLWWATVSTLIDEQAWREPLIYDMSGVESAALLLNLPNLVPLVADLARLHGPRGAVAAVVRGTEVEVWRQRLSTLFDAIVVVEAFPDITTAHDWLDRMEAAPTADSLHPNRD
jgi:hypothetical protein